MFHLPTPLQPMKYPLLLQCHQQQVMMLPYEQKKGQHSYYKIQQTLQWCCTLYFLWDWMIAVGNFSSTSLFCHGMRWMPHLIASVYEYKTEIAHRWNHEGWKHKENEIHHVQISLHWQSSTNDSMSILSPSYPILTNRRHWISQPANSTCGKIKADKRGSIICKWRYEVITL